MRIIDGAQSQERVRRTSAAGFQQKSGEAEEKSLQGLFWFFVRVPDVKPIFEFQDTIDTHAIIEGMQKSAYVIPDTTLILGHSMGEYPLLLRDLPSDEKPREKLAALGPESLTVQELTAILLVTGTTKEDVLEMSTRVVRDYGEKNVFAEKSVEKLAHDLDIPVVKACQIVAAGELGRRFYGRSPSTFTTVRTAKDVYEYVADMRTLPKEHLRGLYLNGHNRIIRDEVISIGTVNANIIHAREIFRTAIECNAVALILVHNHPSGEVTPSLEDAKVTESLIEAGKIIGIRILDHVIVTKDAFASVNAHYNS